MAEEIYHEAIVDVVGPNAMLSVPYTIKVVFLLLPATSGFLPRTEFTPKRSDASSAELLLYLLLGVNGGTTHKNQLLHPLL